MGFSHAARDAMVGMTEFPELFAAGVEHSGLVDFATYIRDNEPTRRAVLDLKITDPVAKEQACKKTLVDYVFFPDEGHWIHKSSNRVKSISKMVEFLDKYL